MSIVEKLGIERMERRHISDFGEEEGYIPVCRDEYVEEIEDQRDDMLEALIDDILEDEEEYKKYGHWPVSELANSSCDGLKKEYGSYCRKLKAIQSATGKTWAEIKELL